MIDQVLVTGKIGPNGESQTETYFADIVEAVKAAKHEWISLELGRKPDQINGDWIEFDGKWYFAFEFNTCSFWFMHTTLLSGELATMIYDDTENVGGLEMYEEPLNAEYEVLAFEEYKDDYYYSLYFYTDEQLNN